MTEILYFKDVYIKEFDAVITRADSTTGKLRVTLDRTSFYPGGGGQPNDEGWIILNEERYEITKVKREGADIWHTIDGDLDTLAEFLKSGASISCELDWDRRYVTMRTHTAMHILCGVVWRDYGASVTGGNMEPGKGRMDFEFERMNKDLVLEIENRCNDEVSVGRVVVTDVLPRDEALQIPDLIRTKINLIPESVKEIRTVEIVGLDLQADGGTHVGNTKEVGHIRLVDYKSKGAINKRIYLEII